MTPSGIEPATCRFVAYCLNHYANAYPQIKNTYIYIKLSTYTRISINTYVYTHTKHTYIHTNNHTHTYIHTYIHTYLLTYLYTYTYTQISFHTYIHKYILVHAYVDHQIIFHVNPSISSRIVLCGETRRQHRRHE